MIIRGAHALFYDQVALTSNTISTGTANLLISNSQSGSSTIYDKQRPGFDLVMNPGQVVDRYFLLKNASPSDVVFDIYAHVSVNSGTSSLIEAISFEFMPVDSEGVPIPGAENTSVALDRLTRDQVQLNSPPIAKGAVQRYRLRQSVSGFFGGQGEATSFDLQLVGRQHL